MFLCIICIHLLLFWIFIGNSLNCSILEFIKITELLNTLCDIHFEMYKSLKRLKKNLTFYHFRSANTSPKKLIFNTAICVPFSLSVLLQNTRSCWGRMSVLSGLTEDWKEVIVYKWLHTGVFTLPVLSWHRPSLTAGDRYSLLCVCLWVMFCFHIQSLSVPLSLLCKCSLDGSRHSRKKAPIKIQYANRYISKKTNWNSNMTSFLERSAFKIWLTAV